MGDAVARLSRPFDLGGGFRKRRTLGDRVSDFAAEASLGVFESAMATTRGLNKILGAPGKAVPELNFLPPIYLATLISDELDPILEEGREAASELGTGTISGTAGRITGRIAGDIAQIAASGGTSVAFGKLGAGAASRLGASAGLSTRIGRIAGGAGRSTPLAFTQAAAGQEESAIGGIADLTEMFGVENAWTNRMQEIAEDPLERILAETALDYTLGFGIEAIGPAVRRLRAARRLRGRSRPDTTVTRTGAEPAVGEPLTRTQELRQRLGGRLDLPPVPDRPLRTLEEAVERVRAGQGRERLTARDTASRTGTPAPTPKELVEEPTVAARETPVDATRRLAQQVDDPVERTRLGLKGEAGQVSRDLMQILGGAAISTAAGLAGAAVDEDDPLKSGAVTALATAGILLGVNNARLRRELAGALTERRRAERLAQVDELTGLGSVNAWRRALPAAEQDPGTAVMMLDIGNLKAMNDLVSFQAGDALIARAAVAVREAADAVGLGERVFRAGGDEVGVLAPADQAEEIAQRAITGFGKERVPGTDFENFLRVGIGQNLDEADIRVKAAKDSETGQRFRNLKREAGTETGLALAGAGVGVGLDAATGGEVGEIQAAGVGALALTVPKRLKDLEGVKLFNLTPGMLDAVPQRLRRGEVLSVQPGVKNPGPARVQNLEQLEQLHPNPLASADAWRANMWQATGSRGVVRTPTQAVEYVQSPELLARELGQLSPEQIQAVDRGFQAAQAIGEAYRTGRARPEKTGLLALWSFLSRSKAAFPHESAFLSVADSPQLNGFINAAFRGEWTDDVDAAYRSWASSAMAEGNPGRAAQDNLNAFGAQFLRRMSERPDDAVVGAEGFARRFPVAGDETGGFRVREGPVPNEGSIGSTFNAGEVAELPGIRQVRLDEFASPGSGSARAQELAAEIRESGELAPLIVAIDAEGPYILEGANRFDALRVLGAESFPAKVVFTNDAAIGGTSKLARLHEMLRDEVPTKDIRRWFFTNVEGAGMDTKLFNFTLLAAGRNDVLVIDRIQARHLWDAKRIGFDPFEEGGVASFLSGTRGLAVYEALERGMAQSVEQAYQQLGRPGSLSRFHWESWVLKQNSLEDHASLNAFARNPEAAITRGIRAEETRFGTFNFGAQFFKDADGLEKIGYRLSNGDEVILDASVFQNAMREVRKPSNRIVPRDFKVSASGGRPWWERPDVNRRRLDDFIAAQPGARRVQRGADGFGPAQRPGPDAGGGRGRGGGGDIPERLARGLESEHPGLTLELRDTSRRDAFGRTVWNLDSIVVPAGGRGAGVGSTVMRRITEAADEAGAILTLRPSTDFGATSIARLRRFYGRFGFRRNIGRRSDDSLPTGMIRNPRGEAGFAAREVVTTLGSGAAGAIAGTIVAPEDQDPTAAILGFALGTGLGARAAARRAGRTSDTAQDIAVSAAEELRAEPGRIPTAMRQASLGVSAPVPGRVQFGKFGLDDIGQRKLEETVEGMGRIRRRVTFDEVQTAATRMGLEDITRADLNDQVDGVTLLAIRQQYQANNAELKTLQARLDDLAAGPRSQRSPLAQAIRPEARQVEEWRVTQEINRLERENEALLRIFIPRASDAGRTLNSLKILARQNLDDPWPWLVKAQRLAARDLLPEERAAIERFVQRGDAQGLVSFVRGLAAPTKTFSLEGLNLIRRAGLLTGLRTQARNFLSNTAEQAMQTVDNPVAVLGDRIASAVIARASGGKLTGSRTRALKTLADRIRAGQLGARRGLQKMQQVMRGIEVDEGTLRRLDLRREASLDNKIADSYVKFMFRLQGAADQPFRQVAYMSSLIEQARVLGRSQGRQGADLERFIDDILEKPPDDLVMQAALDSEEAVFQNASTIGRLVGGAKSSLRTTGQGRGLGAQSARLGSAVLDFVVPFSQTPSAVIGRLVERTPIGLASSIGGLFELWSAAKGGADITELQKMQRQIANRFGRGATGTMAILLGYDLASEGKMSGRWPEDQSEARLWLQEGKSEDSIRIGDRWFRLNGLSPVGNLMALGAQLHQDLENPDAELQSDTISLGAQLTTNFMLGAARTVKEQSFLRGVNDLLGAIDNDRGMADRFLLSSARSFIPILVGDVARFIDPVMRDPQNFPEAFASRVPFMSIQVPARVDEFGRPRVDEEGTPRFTRLVDPFLSTKDRTIDDPILRELNRVGATVSRPRRLEGEDQLAFNERRAFEGRQEIEAIATAMENELYRQLQVPEQQDVLQDVITAVRRQLRGNGRVPASWRPTVARVVQRARERRLDR